MASLLVVDDDDGVRDTLYELFSEEHLCHSAESAEQALEWLNTESYDVVLTDISMPGLSGVELLSHVKQKQPRTQVIVISGIADRTHAEGLLKLGAFAYILKPFQLEDVERIVADAIDQGRQ